MDLANADQQAKYPELMAVIQERNLPYPLVAVNGRVRVAGSADYYRILPLVEEALAVVQDAVTA